MLRELFPQGHDRSSNMIVWLPLSLDAVWLQSQASLEGSKLGGQIEQTKPRQLGCLSNQPRVRTQTTSRQLLNFFEISCTGIFEEFSRLGRFWTGASSAEIRQSIHCRKDGLQTVPDTTSEGCGSNLCMLPGLRVRQDALYEGGNVGGTKPHQPYLELLKGGCWWCAFYRDEGQGWHLLTFLPSGAAQILPVLLVVNEEFECMLVRLV